MRDFHQDAPFRLITIPFSHFCEKGRWALDRLRIPYEEEGHVPILHYAATYSRGAGRTVPVLTSRAGVFADSTDILKYLDGFARPEERLYPEDPALRGEVLALEELFDDRLGPATRLWAYYHLLPQRELLLQYLEGTVPGLELATLRLIYPAAGFMMRRKLSITPERVAQGLVEVREIFGQVAQRLKDGRPYLCGERLSAADLSFGALGAPVVLPPGYQGPIPPYEELPRVMLELVDELRAHPAGAFILKLFREHRLPA
jgi:glutathione S-transferase